MGFLVLDPFLTLTGYFSVKTALLFLLLYAAWLEKLYKLFRKNFRSIHCLCEANFDGVCYIFFLHSTTIIFSFVRIIYTFHHNLAPTPKTLINTSNSFHVTHLFAVIPLPVIPKQQNHKYQSHQNQRSIFAYLRNDFFVALCFIILRHTAE